MNGRRGHGVFLTVTGTSPFWCFAQAVSYFSLFRAERSDTRGSVGNGRGVWHRAAPLIRILKTAVVSDVHQPWYADNDGAGGHFHRIKRYFEKLQEYGPPQGYFPEPSKSILIVQEHAIRRKRKRTSVSKS